MVLERKQMQEGIKYQYTKAYIKNFLKKEVWLM